MQWIAVGGWGTSLLVTILAAWWRWRLSDAHDDVEAALEERDRERRDRQSADDEIGRLRKLLRIRGNDIRMLEKELNESSSPRDIGSSFRRMLSRRKGDE